MMLKWTLLILMRRLLLLLKWTPNMTKKKVKQESINELKSKISSGLSSCNYGEITNYAIKPVVVIYASAFIL